MKLRSLWAKRALVLAFSASAFLSLAMANDKKPAVTVDTAPRASEQRLLSDLYYIAGEECEGRGVLTQGINKAADYIVKQMQAVGMEPAGVDGTWFQPFKIIQQIKKGEGSTLEVTANGNKVTGIPDQSFTPLAIGGPGSITDAPLAFLGFGISSKDPAYDDYSGMNVDGKVVIILRKLPHGDAEFKGKDALASMVAKLASAVTAKAKAVIFVSEKEQSGEKDDLATLNAFGRGDGEGIPVFHVKRQTVSDILTAAGESNLDTLEKQIQDEFKPKSKLLNAKITLKADLTITGINCKNVLATIPGSGELANEIVVVGAHYDHLGRGEPGSMAGRSKDVHWGADDNGSGTVTLMEIARRWSNRQQGDKSNANRRRVIFQWYSAEERGLVGSDHYCKKPLWPLEKTASMFNLDMVGRYGYDELKGTTDAAKEAKYPLEVIGIDSAKEFSEVVDKANEKFNVSLAKKNAGTALFGNSDHYSFYQKKVPVLFFFTGLHPQYHRPIDTWRTINYQGMRQISELGDELLVSLATMKKPEFHKKETKPAATAEQKSDRPAMPAVRLGLEIDYNDEATGISLKGVNAEGLAAKAGVQAGDRILSIGGTEIKNVEAYMVQMRKYKAGDEIELIVQRNGEKKTIKVKTKQ